MLVLTTCFVQCQLLNPRYCDFERVLGKVLKVLRVLNSLLLVFLQQPMSSKATYYHVTKMQEPFPLPSMNFMYPTNPTVHRVDQQKRRPEPAPHLLPSQLRKQLGWVQSVQWDANLRLQGQPKSCFVWSVWGKTRQVRNCSNEHEIQYTGFVVFGIVF